MYKPDSIDEQIVQLLGVNAQQRSEALAEQLKISPATIRRRIKKLIENDVLRIVGVVNPSDFGLTMPVIIAIDIVQSMVESVIDHLTACPEIRWISSTAGRYDVIA